MFGLVLQVKVANIPGKKLEHQGIRVQLIGQIELASERGHPHDFVSLGMALPLLTLHMSCLSAFILYLRHAPLLIDFLFAKLASM